MAGGKSHPAKTSHNLGDKIWVPGFWPIKNDLSTCKFRLFPTRDFATFWGFQAVQDGLKPSIFHGDIRWKTGSEAMKTAYPTWLFYRHSYWTWPSRNSMKYWIFPLNMVIFHSYVKLPEDIWWDHSAWICLVAVSRSQKGILPGEAIANSGFRICTSPRGVFFSRESGFTRPHSCWAQQSVLNSAWLVDCESQLVTSLDSCYRWCHQFVGIRGWCLCSSGTFEKQAKESRNYFGSKWIEYNLKIESMGIRLA